MTPEAQRATTIPAPAPVAQCGCGRTYDPSEWASLHLVADRWEGLQLRNCQPPCLSTLAVEVSL